MASKLDIWSQASIHLGNGPQSSLDANNALCNAVRVVYDSVIESKLAGSRWGFARKKAVLSKLASTPENTYQYEYQIPGEALAIFAVYPNTNYKIYRDRIYSNMDSLEVDYIYHPGEGYFPNYFVYAVSLELARTVAYQVTKDVKLLQVIAALAGDAWKTAWTVDAQQHTTEELVDQPLIWARHA